MCEEKIENMTLNNKTIVILFLTEKGPCTGKRGSIFYIRSRKIPFLFFEVPFYQSSPPSLSFFFVFGCKSFDQGAELGLREHYRLFRSTFQKQFGSFSPAIVATMAIPLAFNQRRPFGLQHPIVSLHDFVLLPTK